MQIKYIIEKEKLDYIQIKSFITERRKHNKLVDSILLVVPVRASSKGFIIKTTLIFGKEEHIARICQIIRKNINYI